MFNQSSNSLPFLSILQVLDTNYHYVKPKNKDVNDNILSEVVRDLYGITEDKIKNAFSLEEVLREVCKHHCSTYLL